MCRVWRPDHEFPAPHRQRGGAQFNDLIELRCFQQRGLYSCELSLRQMRPPVLFWTVGKGRNLVPRPGPEIAAVSTRRRSQRLRSSRKWRARRYGFRLYHSAWLSGGRRRLIVGINSLPRSDFWTKLPPKRRVITAASCGVY
jgi:hypothetical protein